MKTLWGAAALLAALYASALFVPALGFLFFWTSRHADGPAIVLSLRDDANAAVEVVGLAGETLAWLRQDRPADQWAAVLKVSVTPDQPAMLGRYAVDDDRLRFTPSFPLDPGREYHVVFTTPDPGGSMIGTVSLPAVDHGPATTVARIYPSGGVVPENQLRLYIHFSGPMGRKGGLEFVHLLDERGQEVKDPFLPLDTEFFNDDRTRYTVFFDPGRQKRGILPNQQMGRSLLEGQQYTLLVDAAWPDTHGRPLKETFRQTFRVAPPDEKPLDPKTWTIHAPAAGSREPLEVIFPEALDHGLLLRAMGVAAAGGGMLAGEVDVRDNEKSWRFTPQDQWRAGAHQLIALAMLEDLAGNRIGRAFEVDQFDRSDRSPEPERTAIPFTVAAR